VLPVPADGRCTRRALVCVAGASRTDPEAARRRRSQPRASTCSRCREHDENPSATGRRRDALAVLEALSLETLSRAQAGRKTLSKVGVRAAALLCQTRRLAAALSARCELNSTIARRGTRHRPGPSLRTCRSAPRGALLPARDVPCGRREGAIFVIPNVRDGQRFTFVLGNALDHPSRGWDTSGIP